MSEKVAPQALPERAVTIQRLTRVALLVKAKYRESSALRAWLMEEGAPALLGRLPMNSSCSVGLIEEHPWSSSGSGRDLPFDAIVEVWCSQAVASAAFTSLVPHTSALHLALPAACDIPPAIRPRVTPLAIWSFADGAEPDNGSSRVRECLNTTFPDAEQFPYGRICSLLPHSASVPSDMTVLEMRYPPTQDADLIAASQRLRQCAAELSMLTGEFYVFTVRWHLVQSRPPAAQCRQRNLQPWTIARRYEEARSVNGSSA